MPVTRSTAAERPRFRAAAGPRAVWRFRELLWSLSAALLIAAGLWFVYRAKTQEFGAIEQGLQAKQLVNLNNLSAREDLLPVLSKFYSDSAEREFVARKI